MQYTYWNGGTSAATSYSVAAIAIDHSGNVWVADGGNDAVTKLSSSGTTIGTYTVGSFPHAIAIDSSGNVWVVNNGNGTPGTASGDSNVMELNSSGTTIGTYVAGSYPRAIAIDSFGDVWVANWGSDTVTKFPGIATGPQYFPYSGPQYP